MIKLSHLRGERVSLLKTCLGIERNGGTDVQAIINKLIVRHEHVIASFSLVVDTRSLFDRS
jgi:hypothetical protein